MSDSHARVRPRMTNGPDQPALARSSDRLLLVAMSVLLVACFVTGGSSQESGLGVSVTQLLAIPVLAYALTMALQRGRLVDAWPGIALSALILLVPLLQLLPIPESMWKWSPSRLRLEQDLSRAGVSGVHYFWTLAPAATKRAALFLLPAAALFLSALALNRESLRRVLWLLIVTSALGLLLGIAQLGFASDSILNPYPQYTPSGAGVFANPNHQADALVIGLVLSVAIVIDEARRARRGGGSRAIFRACVALSLLFGLGLLLVRSRAGIIIGIFATVATLITCRAISLRTPQGSWAAKLRLIVVASGLALAVYGASVGLQVEEIDSMSGLRGKLAQQTLVLGTQGAPLGSGVGSFVPVFEQEADRSFLENEYMNHAHNEYVQWWLEGGVLAIVCMVVAVMVFLQAARLLVRLGDSRLRTNGLAAMIAVMATLAHSVVDYPLRTPALMAVIAALAGVLFSATTYAKATDFVGRAN